MNMRNTYARLAHLGARVALGLVRLEEGGVVARTRGVAGRARDRVEALGAVHADGGGGRERARVLAARSLARTALRVRLELALAHAVLARVPAARLLALVAVAAVALLALLHNAVATQRARVF